MLTKLFRSFWFKHSFARFQWYRRWYGGRWERHWIDICGSCMWLDMHPERCWPAYRQPCSFGTPEIEDYPMPEASR
ncbi:hypothetical protein [Variovorax sp. DAIF25]|uniref:hypothetical protein n=1 Tax=Variovorax sp. DAIF25 TaxID=3080983 RepID=UPI003D6BD702